MNVIELLNLEDIDKYISKKCKTKTKNKKTKKLQEAPITITFDTETTSVLLNDDNTQWFRNPKLSSEDNDKIASSKRKYSWVYIWMISIDHHNYYSRDLNELNDFIELLNSYDKFQFYIWAHNYTFDFHFVQCKIPFASVFAPQSHNVYKSEYGNINFRCSYILSGLGLDKTLESCNSPVKKLKGDLDYSLTRHYKTELSETEMAYCENDVDGLCYYIDFMKKKYGSYADIPLTKTSVVRAEVIKYFQDIFTPLRQNDIYNLLVQLAITDVDLYEELLDCNIGGYTHASCFNARKHLKVIDKIRMFGRDKTSSYPAQSLLDKFPMTKYIMHTNGREIVDKITENTAKTEGVLFTVELHNISSKRGGTFISSHKASDIKNPTLDNGKVFKADSLQVTVNEWGWLAIKMIYDFDDDYDVFNCYTCKKKYLPLHIRLAILEFYRLKTTLKGVPDMEVEYNWHKTNVNSIFGTMDMSVIFGDIVYGEYGDYTFTDMWKDKVHGYTDEEKHELKQEALDKEVRKYTNSNRMENWRWKNDKDKYPYTAVMQWGMTVTTSCQYELLKLCDAIGWRNVIYCDTDSIKFVAFDEADLERINKIFERFECKQKHRILDAIEYTNHEIDIENGKIRAYNEYKKKEVKKLIKNVSWEDFAPKDIHGEEHPIGYFPQEDEYTDFKALGAKRYMYRTPDGTVKTTVSGISKKKLKEYLEKESKGDVDKMFDMFDNELTVPSEETGKNTHTYHLPLDKPIEITDYNGVKAMIEPTTGCCLTPQPFSMKLSTDYLEFLESDYLIQGYIKR